MSGQHERCEELMMDRELWGLDAEEQRELVDVARQTGAQIELVARQWARAAGAATAALLSGRTEPMPAPLLRKVEAQALGYFVEQRGRPLRDLASMFDAPAAASPSAPAAVRSVPWFSYLVTAAALLVAALAWVTRPSTPNPLPAAERRTALLAEGDVLRLEWAAGGPRGDVVWSDARQEGFLRLRGLPVNDPARQQYQLWIFDAARDPAQPVDGGVFDITTADAEVVVPIRAKLDVHHGQAFAVTVEAPGGVVVSKREQIVAAAGL